MDDPTDRIERELTTLFRRVQKIHLSTSHGEFDLERSAYGILCRIADEGPQRLGFFATAFGLDPSTITRQVQALEKAGLAVRERDQGDKRVSVLDLTPEGREVLAETRQFRRSRLEAVLADWSDEDRRDFARLVASFNTSVDRLLLADPAAEAGAPGPATGDEESADQVRE